MLPNGQLITTEKGLPRVKVVDEKPRVTFFHLWCPKTPGATVSGRKHAYAVDVVVGADEQVYIADRKETGAQMVRVYKAIPGFVSPMVEGAAQTSRSGTEKKQ